MRLAKCTVNPRTDKVPKVGKAHFHFKCNGLYHTYSIERKKGEKKGKYIQREMYPNIDFLKIALECRSFPLLAHDSPKT